MIIEKIQGLAQGTVIPKPKSTADFKIKGWGKRRGEDALTYSIPNHKNPGKPLIKGITVTEFEHAYSQLLKSERFTRTWFNINLEACAKEGSCNFTTIGGVFQLLGLAHYVPPGTYVLNATTIAADSNRVDLNAMFDEILTDALKEQAIAPGNRSVLNEVTDSLDAEGKARFDAAIEGLGKLFGPKSASNDSQSNTLTWTDPHGLIAAKARCFLYFVRVMDEHGNEYRYIGKTRSGASRLGAYRQNITKIFAGRPNDTWTGKISCDSSCVSKSLREWPDL